MTSSVLIIDDNLSFLQGLILTLELSGFKVLTAPNGAAGVDMARKYHPDIILCDITMDGLDGFSVKKSLKQHPKTVGIPVIFLTGRTQDADIEYGFSLGAEDYIKKPCNLNETVYRIKAVLERTKKRGEEIGPRIYGQLYLDIRRLIVFIEGRETHLSPTETLILNELMQRPNTIVSSVHLAQIVLEKDEVDAHDRAVISTHIYNLRHKRLKLERTRATYIVTEGHQGYRLFSEETGLELTPDDEQYRLTKPNKT